MAANLIKSSGDYDMNSISPVLKALADQVNLGVTGPTGIGRWSPPTSNPGVTGMAYWTGSAVAISAGS